MANITTDQIAEILFKRKNNVATTNIGKYYATEEPKNSYSAIYLNQIWIDDVPVSNPFDNNSSHGEVIGNLKLFNAQLNNILGTSAFEHPNLKNIIPFNYGSNTSYSYSLKTSGNVTITSTDATTWYLDTESGTLIFLQGDTLATTDVGNLPSGVTIGNPPILRCVQYIGRLGSDTGWGNGGNSSTSGNDYTGLSGTNSVVAILNQQGYLERGNEIQDYLFEQTTYVEFDYLLNNSTSFILVQKQVNTYNTNLISSSLNDSNGHSLQTVIWSNGLAILTNLSNANIGKLSYSNDYMYMCINFNSSNGQTTWIRSLRYLS